MKNQEALQGKGQRKGRSHTYINNAIDIGPLKSDMKFKEKENIEQNQEAEDILRRATSNHINSLNMIDQRTGIRKNSKTNSITPKRDSKKKSSKVLPDVSQLGNQDERSKFLGQLGRQADLINSKLGDLLKRSEKLNDNAKRLTNQIEGMVKE